MQHAGPVPSFYLYGEPHRAAAPGFVHVEWLDDRSRPSEWTIRPHAHRELAQLILIAKGGGEMRAEARGVRFDAPCLLVIPAGIIHGFQWFADSEGMVLTMASAYLAGLAARDPDIAALFTEAAALPLDKEAAARTEDCAGEIMRELGWAAAGHRTAVDAALLRVLLAAIRARAVASGKAAPASSPYAALVARLRARIEERFRLREPIPDHAAALGVSVTALRNACARIAGAPPAMLVDERAMLEARRALLYSNLSIAEIGYALGFADPGHFSRFFTHYEGRSPRAFRAGAGL
ncbi:helix-turn-helix domain-containing protein [Acidocella sp.]|uniref:helix-turn-helix domain-containing protein n=1 Tax=Acidocella sp. TaxID=50710 RepID=UPI003CFD6975